MKPKSVLSGHKGPVLAITYSSDPGQYVLTSSADRLIRLFNPSHTNSRQSPPAAGSSSPPSLPHPETIQTYSPATPVTLSLAVSHSSSHFLSSGASDRSVLYWDVSTGTNIRRFGGHVGRVTAVAFAGSSPSSSSSISTDSYDPNRDSVAVSGGQDRCVKLWDLRSGHSFCSSPLMTLSDAKDAISDIRLSGTDIFAASHDGKVRVYDIRTGRLTTDTISSEPATCVYPSSTTASAHPNHRSKPCATAYLVGSLTKSSTPEIRMIDRSNGTLLKQYRFPHLGSIPLQPSLSPSQPSDLRARLAFGPLDAHVLSSAGPSGKVFVWDTLSGTLLTQVDHSKAAGSQESYITDIAVCPGSVERGDSATTKDHANSLSSGWKAGWEWCSAGSDGNVVCWVA